jgi:ADP-glucose pyrophosphorylase
MSESLTCIIPAAGEATRLRPHSLIEQKPMMLMGSPDRRIIDGPLDLAYETDATFVVVSNDENRTRSLERHVRARSEAQVLRDRQLMGAASLIHFSDVLFESNPDGSSLIQPADHIIEGVDLQAFHDHHLARDKDVTMLTVSPKPYGQYIQERDGVAINLTSDLPERGLSSAGVYIVKNRRMLEWARQERKKGWNGESRSFLGDVIQPSVAEDAVTIYRLPETGYWDDAGTIERYHYNNMRLSGGDNVIDTMAFVHPEAAIRRSIIMGSAAITAGAIIESVIISANKFQQYETRV